PPQFVDIDLEDDEDSSDEEYCPDDEEEEEDTAEETFLSDADSFASPPRMHCSQPRPPAVHIAAEPLQRSAGQPSEEVTAPQLLPAAPAEFSFMERLNAVEEELDSSLYSFNQSLDRKPDDGAGGSSCLAYRTRSKLPLVDVPLEQLEAELLAPDITADMYDEGPPQLEEDRHWTRWLQGLMAPHSEGSHCV
ncbi:LOW QUALITY PROTEIN: GON-4-like protein, partial [Scomber scombrus]